MHECAQHYFRGGHDPSIPTPEFGGGMHKVQTCYNKWISTERFLHIWMSDRTRVQGLG